jgi:hypothetical protein
MRVLDTHSGRPQSRVTSREFHAVLQIEDADRLPYGRGSETAARSAEGRSGQRAESARPTAIPKETSKKRCMAICQPLVERGAVAAVARAGEEETDSLTVAALKRGSVTRLSHAAQSRGSVIRISQAAKLRGSVTRLGHPDQSSGSVRLLSYTFEGRIAGMQDVSEPRP